MGKEDNEVEIVSGTITLVIPQPLLMAVALILASFIAPEYSRDPPIMPTVPKVPLWESLGLLVTISFTSVIFKLTE